MAALAAHPTIAISFATPIEGILMRKAISGIIVAAGLSAVSLSVPAQAQVDIMVNVAPPAPRYERVPPPRHGYVWAPGRWHWAGGRYAWNPGHWMAERPGYRWEAGAWNRRGPGWHYVPGHWVR
jgi:hypothetical protein